MTGEPPTLFWIGRLGIGIKFEPRDLWVGVYWDRETFLPAATRRTTIYVCIIPTLPIIFDYEERLR